MRKATDQRDAQTISLLWTSLLLFHGGDVTCFDACHVIWCGGYVIWCDVIACVVSCHLMQCMRCHVMCPAMVTLCVRSGSVTMWWSKVLFCTTKYYSSTTPVLLCTTKYYSSTTLYYTVLQRTTPVLPCTTKYYSVLQSTTPVLLCTTKYYSSTTLYYTVLQRTTPVLLCTKVLLQYYSVLHSTTTYYSSTTLYYNVLLQYYSVLQSTTPVIPCTTKYYSSTTLYYKVLLQYYSVLHSTTTYYSSTTLYYKVLLCTAKYYSSTTLYYTVLQRTTPVLQSSIHDWSLTHMNRYLHDWCPSHMKRHLQCAEQQESSSNFTKYCTCHAKWLWRLIRVTYETSFTMRGATGVTIQLHQILRLPRKMNLMIDPRLTWNVIYNARSNRNHNPTSPNTAPATQNESHDWSASDMKRHLQCAEQQTSHDKFTKYCACHAKWISWLIRVTYETSFPMRGASKVTLQPHQILRLPRNLQVPDFSGNSMNCFRQ